MKALEFTQNAIEDLEDILRWTLKTFGLAQSEIYKQELLARCKDIAGGQRSGRECTLLLGPAMRTNMRYLAAGQHFVIYLETEKHCIVVGFLHQSSNLPKHLARLTDRFEGS